MQLPHSYKLIKISLSISWIEISGESCPRNFSMWYKSLFPMQSLVLAHSHPWQCFTLFCNNYVLCLCDIYLILLDREQCLRSWRKTRVDFLGVHFWSKPFLLILLLIGPVPQVPCWVKDSVLTVSLVSIMVLEHCKEKLYHKKKMRCGIGKECASTWEQRIRVLFLAFLAPTPRSS